MNDDHECADVTAIIVVVVVAGGHVAVAVVLNSTPKFIVLVSLRKCGKTGTRIALARQVATYTKNPMPTMIKANAEVRQVELNGLQQYALVTVLFLNHGGLN